MLTNEEPAERRGDTTYQQRLARLRDLVLYRVGELRAAQKARETVEGRYLDGHPALFPDAVKAWEEQLIRTEALADLACRLAQVDGVSPAELADPTVLSARVLELVADLVEPAKATALEKLGEGHQAQALATAWFRAKSEPLGPAGDAAD